MFRETQLAAEMLALIKDENNHLIKEYIWRTNYIWYLHHLYACYTLDCNIHSILGGA